MFFIIKFLCLYKVESCVVGGGGKKFIIYGYLEFKLGVGGGIGSIIGMWDIEMYIMFWY